MDERADLSERSTADPGEPVTADRAAEPGERSTADLERDIEATRESIGTIVDQIGDKLHDAVDWRVYVRRNPWMAMLVAGGAGILLGRFAARRLRARREPDRAEGHRRDPPPL